LTVTDLAFALPEFSIKTVILLFSLSSRSSGGFVETSATSSVVVPSTLKTIVSSVDVHRCSYMPLTGIIEAFIEGDLDRNSVCTLFDFILYFNRD